MGWVTKTEAAFIFLRSVSCTKIYNIGLCKFAVGGDLL